MINRLKALGSYEDVGKLVDAEFEETGLVYDWFHRLACDKRYSPRYPVFKWHDRYVFVYEKHIYSYFICEVPENARLYEIK